MKIISRYFYVFLLLLSGCLSTCQEKDMITEEALPVINLSDNVEEVSILNLSDAAESVKIVRLETSTKSLIGYLSDIQVTDNDIWIANNYELVLRFSHDGRFLNSVGKLGQGPKEYPQLNSFIVDDESKEVFIFSSIGIQVYDYEGNHMRKDLNQGIYTLHSTPYYSQLRYNGQWLLSQNITMYNYYENAQDSLWSIAIVDENFNKIKRFKNPAHIGRESEIAKHGLNQNTTNYDFLPWTEDKTVYDFYNGELTFKFPDTDTIYIYNDNDLTLHPLFTIDSNEKRGDYGMTHEIYPTRKAYDYFNIINYYSTKDYIYLLGSKGDDILTYAYNKSSHVVRSLKRVSKIVPNNQQRVIRLTGHDSYSQIRRFIITNDINGGDFYVRFRSGGKYWICVLLPGTGEYETYLSNLEKFVDAPHKDELINELSKVNEEDNPILLLAKLK